MRVAVITESFLPHVDGVTNSVCRVLEHLRHRGHEALVIAPAAGTRAPAADPDVYAGAPVLRAPSVPLPGYPAFRVATPWPRLVSVLADFRPDVVHLAAPAGLGAQSAFAAWRLGLPSVAVYQTDFAGFAARYGLAQAERSIWRWVATVHRLAGRTLAPSWPAVDMLLRQGVHRVARWTRGVDLERFNPCHRNPALRHDLAPDGEVLVGYVGRLAREKRVHLLDAVQDLPGMRLVIVGDGPMRPALERRLPRATFLGFRSGAELATIFASLDVFVHTGSHETFCQAAQEAKASGVPVVAPAAGGLLDVVDDGHTGMHFMPDSPAALADRVATLVADAGWRAAMGLAARQSVTGCGWNAIGDELIGHYQDVRGLGMGHVGGGALRSRTVLARRMTRCHRAVGHDRHDRYREDRYREDDSYGGSYGDGGDRVRTYHDEDGSTR
ncbi:glycosyltransferase family 4 protein [Protofrankia symbiont of Coriaria ruscifolia]|uniref:glycosyltransferase family 4 protein n=1 Tax=Protofrankia symbiont of Coriaria ruscifolia TaxID=1306542 RepID=UPI0013EFBCEE|nr:glycosyltransferase family 1 protein [Protofrankia symbiont of Coriaria ruscifolia]